MHHIRGKLTYANVVATLALFLVLAGGTAFAAVQLEKESVGTSALKKEAVSLAKIKKKAKEKLKGQTGPQGPKGDKGPKGDAGEAGSALGFARVSGINGAIKASKNISAANVSIGAENGVICFKELPFKWSVVSATRAGSSSDPGVVNWLEGKGNGCPAGTEVTLSSRFFNEGKFVASSNEVMVVFN